MRTRNNRTVSKAMLEALEARQLLSAAVETVVSPNILMIADANHSSPVGGYTAKQVQAAYGFNKITFSNGGTAANGSGQTIAIVDAYNHPSIASDLSVFDKQMGLPAPPSLKVVSQTGGSVNKIATNAGWATEIALDVEWAHAIAPAANLLLVEAKSASLSDLLTAVNFAKNASNVSAVSMSWGAGEFTSESSYDNAFITPNGHNGVTFVSASGDSGSWYGPEWPASSPNVMAVGGTSLYTDSSGNYVGESAWSGSGGGVSSYEVEPSYQNIVQSTGAKSSPDVSYDADPNTGFAVYDSISYQGSSGWMQVGGTSAGAPQWAALIAIANQGRAINHLSTLNGTTDTLPKLYSLYTASQYTTNFNDVMTGSSSSYYSAGTGYDAVTGLGTPKAPAVVSSLGATVSSTATASASTATTTSSQSSTPATSGKHSSHNRPNLARTGAAPIDVIQTQTSTPFVSLPALSMPGSSSAAANHSLLAAGDAAPLVAPHGINSGGPSPFSSTTLITPATVSFAGTLSATLAEDAAASQAMSAMNSAGRDLIGMIAHSVASASSHSIAASATISPVYTIAHLDGVDRFMETVATFISDSSLAQPFAGKPKTWRAWAITAAVLAVDATLAGIWFQRRSRERRLARRGH